MGRLLPEVATLEIPDLPLMDDLWGRIVLDASRDPEVTYDIRRDDGFLDTGFRPADAELSSAMPPERAEALAFAQGRVLDLGCGPGRCLLWLEERGFEVVGIDISPGALQIARERGARDARLVPIDQVDFPPASFDTAVFTGSTLGVGGGIGIVAKRLARLHPIVRVGGCLITDVREPEATEKPVHQAYHAARKQEGRYPGELRIRLEYACHAGDWFDFTLVNAESVSLAAAHTGWKVREVLGSPELGFVILTRK
jgi:SAM-dependent methyltransferase